TWLADLGPARRPRAGVHSSPGGDPPYPPGPGRPRDPHRRLVPSGHPRRWPVIVVMPVSRALTASRSGARRRCAVILAAISPPGGTGWTISKYAFPFGSAPLGRMTTGSRPIRKLSTSDGGRPDDGSPPAAPAGAA